MPDGRTYFARKAAIQAALEQHLADGAGAPERLVIAVNTLDDATRGANGM